MTRQEVMDLINIAKVYAEDGAFATAAARLRTAADELDKVQEATNEILAEMAAE